MCELDNVLNEVLLLRRILNICQKRPVDLYIVRHVAQEVAYVGIARSVVIYGGLESGIPVLCLHGAELLIVDL